MRTLIALIRGLIYSNLFVSLCMTLMTHLSYIILKLPQTNSLFVLGFIFCSTFITYNLQRIYRLNSVEIMNKFIGIRLGWIMRNRKRLFFMSLLFLVVDLYFLGHVNYKVLVLVAPLGLISVLYVIPMLNKKKAIRQLPFVKIFAIASVWTIVMVVIPVVETSGFNAVLSKNVLWYWFGQFLFILAITLPFDVRDLRYDLASKIKTIPLTIGVRNTIKLSHFILILFIGVNYIQYYFIEHLTFLQFIAITITASLTMGIIAFTARRRPEMFFSGLVDGTMLLMYFGLLLLEY